MNEMFKTFTMIVGMIVMLCFLYQGVYAVLGLIKRPKVFKANQLHKYAVLISARNESTVITNLIESVRAQEYPSELIDIFVVADNCTDNTAEVAKKAGAKVIERRNKVQQGKGYALNFLLNHINRHYGLKAYDGYFVFDADNVLEKNYVEKMNDVFDNGYRIITSYRNSKNYDSNWISAGSALWFLRECRFVNNVRMILGVSCTISGTGFLVNSDIFAENNGWKHFLLTEDIQFSADSILKGERIGYCADAVFYDEQPIHIIDAWNQRLRWTKGFYQVFGRYGKQLITKAVQELNFSCYDMFITLLPAIGFTIISGSFSAMSLVVSLWNPKLILLEAMRLVFFALLNMYLTFFILGFMTTITEWKKIYCSPIRKLLYMFTFPIFMLMYVPLTYVALFTKAKWKPIRHSVVVTVNEIRG